MNKARKAVLVSTVLASMAASGMIGATVFGPSASGAANSNTIAPGGGTGATGTFHSNEDPAHEKSESPEREADENSGKAHFWSGNGGPGGRFHSNEDPAHEKSESAQRGAEENAGQMPTAP